MRLEHYLTESASKNAIVIDIQPMYEKYFTFKTREFVEFLNNNTKKILYFYNGPNTVGVDSKRDMEYWLVENGLVEEKLRNIEFVDKGYAFFRSFMDQGIDASIIIKMIRTMFAKRTWDTRDIENEEWEKILGNDYNDVEGIIDSGDMMYVPDININQLRKFSGSYIMGGGKRECLVEVQLLMSAFNVKATEVRRFIY